MAKHRVLIVAADPLARAGLAALLADREDCAVVGQAADDAGLSLDVYRPDAVLWDLGWDPDSAALPDLEALAPPVIALLPDPTLAADMRAAGARGLLLRHAPPDRIMAAVGAVALGLLALDPALATALALTRPDPLQAEITPRELDVLRLLAEGLANRAIAQRLNISEHTVKFHINAILGKLGAQSRTEAVVNAIRLGLIAV